MDERQGPLILPVEHCEPSHSILYKNPHAEDSQMHVISLIVLYREKEDIQLEYQL